MFVGPFLSFQTNPEPSKFSSIRHQIKKKTTVNKINSCFLNNYTTVIRDIAPQ